MTAHNFLGENDLSPSFLEEVVQFILKNTKNVRVGQEEPQFSDPFTGTLLFTATLTLQNPN